MSLAALLDRYSPDAPLAERRALFEAIAPHLPAPEFLWYETAICALHAEGDELKPLDEKNQQLEARVMDLEDESLMLREDRLRLGAAFEAENARAQRLSAELDDLRARHEALHIELLEQVEAQKQSHQLVVLGL